MFFLLVPVNSEYALGLNRQPLMVAMPGDGEVFDHAFDRPTVSVLHPTEYEQIHDLVVFVALKTLRVFDADFIICRVFPTGNRLFIWVLSKAYLKALSSALAVCWRDCEEASSRKSDSSEIVQTKRLLPKDRFR